MLTCNLYISCFETSVEVDNPFLVSFSFLLLTDKRVLLLFLIIVSILGKIENFIPGLRRKLDDLPRLFKFDKGKE